MKINLIRTNGTIDPLNNPVGSDLGNEVVVKDLLTFSSHMLGKCYNPDNYEIISKEPLKDTLGRQKFCIEKGHHSGFEHAKLTFEMDKIPKIICMLLNNENVYTTSEQSARYTSFENAAQTERERKLYVKWRVLLEKLIHDEYPDFTEKEAQKLAQENARYMISVFVPSSMMYTVDLRQLNYIIRYFEKLLIGNWVRNQTEAMFFNKLKLPLKNFLEQMKDYRVEGLEPKSICEASFFKEMLSNKNIYSDIYAFTYDISFAGQAQNHRHRTIRYRAYISDDAKYFVPKIIRKTEYEKEWLKDIASVENEFPQGRMITVREQGVLEDYVQKCYERICGRAQFEIMELTASNLNMYAEGLYENGEKEAMDKLFEMTNDLSPARCLYHGFKCKDACRFGKKQGERKI